MKCKCSFHNATECALVDNAQRIQYYISAFPPLLSISIKSVCDWTLSKQDSVSGSELYW